MRYHIILNHPFSYFLKTSQLLDTSLQREYSPNPVEDWFLSFFPKFSLRPKKYERSKRGRKNWTKNIYLFPYTQKKAKDLFPF